jgi:hypothetical protein
MRASLYLTASLGIAAIVWGGAGTTFGDDKPAGPTTAPTKKPSSIFDFGLEVGPESPADNEKDAPEKPPKPAPRPAAPIKQPSPARTPAPIPSDPVAQPNGSKGVNVDADGVITSDKRVTLQLKGTENQHFIISGELYPAPEPTQYNNGNILFYFRELSSKKRLTIDIHSVLDKRILFAGESVKKFKRFLEFTPLEPERWYPFTIDAGTDSFTIQYDQQKKTASGAMETGGRNSIVLGPGAKLRNLKITILPPSGQPAPASPAPVVAAPPAPLQAAPIPSPTVAEEPPVIVEEFYFHENYYWFWHPGHRRYEIWADEPPSGYHVHKVDRLPPREEVIRTHTRTHFHPPEKPIHVELHRLHPKGKIETPKKK